MDGTPRSAWPRVRAWLFNAATTQSPAAPIPKATSHTPGPTPHSGRRRTRAVTGSTNATVTAISHSQ